jgi:hypothetical protein
MSELSVLSALFSSALSLSEETPIGAITALIKATQTGKLKWRNTNPLDYLPHVSGFSSLPNIYQASDENFTLSMMERKEIAATDPSDVCSHFLLEHRLRDAVLLVIENKDDKTSRIFYRNSALIDLLSAVKGQLPDITEADDEFLDTTLEYVWGGHRFEKIPAKGWRRKQGLQRRRILEAYKYRCVVSGETTPEVLDVVHIIPISKGGTSEVSNSIVLRSDLHRLFNSGLLSISPNYTVIISRKVHSTLYTVYNDSKLSFPEEPGLRPSSEALKEHNRYFFIGE